MDAHAAGAGLNLTTHSLARGLNSSIKYIKK
jgi:hypothetical protein